MKHRMKLYLYILVHFNLKHSQGPTSWARLIILLKLQLASAEHLYVIQEVAFMCRRSGKLVIFLGWHLV